MKKWLSDYEKIMPKKNELVIYDRSWHTRSWVHPVYNYCTARNMKKADFDFLASHGLNAKIILSRKEGDFRNDAELKTAKLKRLFNLKQFKDMPKIMFDDNKIIRKELQKIGIRTLHQDQLRLK